MRALALCLVLFTAARSLAQTPETDIEVDLDLTQQRAYLLIDGEMVHESPISSGRASHPTPVGDFKVIEKDIDHRSSLYGKILDGRGRVVKKDADSDTPVPAGCHFERAPMRYFMRFEGAAGMHAGNLPGYPASHGCVRMPLEKAKLFYETVPVGSPVYVYGTPPWRNGSDDSHDSGSGSGRTKAKPKATPKPQPKRRFLFFTF